MKEWFQERVGKRISVDTLLPSERGSSYTGIVLSVSDDAVVLQLPNIVRLIAYTAIVSAVEPQEF